MKPTAGRIAAIAFLTRFLQWFSLGLIIPISNLLKMSKGLSLSTLGFSSAMVGVTIMVLEIPTGILADRLGRKNTYILSLFFWLAACAAIFAAEGFIAVTLAFTIYGVSRALSSGSIDALLIDQYIEIEGESKLHRLISIGNIGETLGLAAGALGGGFLPPLWTAMTAAANQYNGNVAAMGLSVTLLLLIVVLFVSTHGETIDKSKSITAFLRDTAVVVKKSRILGLIFVSMAVWGLCFSSIETYWQPRLVEILGTEDSTWLFGILSSLYFLSALLGSVAVPLVIEKTKINLWVLQLILRLLNAGFIIVLSIQSGAVGFGIFYLVMFFWNGMANIPEMTMLNREIPSEYRASILSVTSFTVQLGGACGLLLFGFVAGRASIAAAWQIAAAVFGLSAFLYLAAWRREKKGRGR